MPLANLNSLDIAAVGGPPFHRWQFVADMALLFSLGTYGAENSPDGNPHFWGSGLCDTISSRNIRAEK